MHGEACDCDWDMPKHHAGCPARQLKDGEMFCIERFNGRGWQQEGSGFPNRGEALQEVERLRAVYGGKARFRLVVR